MPPVHVYTFKPVRAQRLMLGVVIYAALVFVLFASLSNVEAAKALRLMAGIPLPVIGVALLLAKRDVLRLSITDREVMIETGSGITRSISRSFPMGEVRFERRPASISIRSGKSTVGTVRKSSATKREWERLLAEIEGISTF